MCKSCFEDYHLPAAALAEQCTTSKLSFSREPRVKAIVTFVCCHGRTHRHTIFPGTDDWAWLEFVTNGWLWCEAPYPKPNSSYRVAEAA